MKKYFFVGLLHLSLQVVKAQTVAPVTLNSIGTSGIVTNVNFECSLSQTFDLTISTAATLTQSVSANLQQTTIAEAQPTSKSKMPGLLVYPNPANQVFSVQLATIAGTTVAIDLQVWDVQGRMVRQYRIAGAAPVRVTGLTPGVYLVKLKQEPDMIQKVVVQ